MNKHIRKSRRKFVTLVLLGSLGFGLLGSALHPTPITTNPASK